LRFGLLLEIDNPPRELPELLLALVDLTFEPGSLANEPRH
jgi:hypothetical protein